LNALNSETILLILSFCPFCNSDTLFASFNMTMQDVTWLVFVKTFCTRITSVFFFGRHYHRICHQLNIYGINSVDVFATLKYTGNTTGAAWRTCAWVEQHPTSLYPTIEWFYTSEMRSCRCCKRWSHALLNSTNLHSAWQFLSVHDLFCDNDVEKFCLYCLICYAHMNLNYTIFVDFFSLCKHIEHQTLYRFFCWLV
jgi:hypothetical protein